MTFENFCQTSHLASSIERLELEGFHMAEVVDRCAAMYEKQQEQHRKARTLKSSFGSNLLW